MPQAESHSRAALGFTRGAPACQRCRRRKQKCDLKYPSCSNCEGASVECLTYHEGKQAELPRNYVSILEAQVKQRDQKIQELQARLRDYPKDPPGEALRETASPTVTGLVSSNTTSPASPRDTSRYLTDLVESVENVVVEPSRQPRFSGHCGGITLARLVMTAIRTDALRTPLVRHTQACQPISSTEATAASLPPRQAAEHLVDIYFQYRTPHLPIIDRSQVAEALEGVYGLENADKPDNRLRPRNTFITYMVFAIALCDLPGPTGKGRPIQSEGCYRSAISCFETVITYAESDIHVLRSVLLLAQFIALCPSYGSLWHLTGIALRMCIDLGLHWETDAQRLSMSPTVLHERRRLWCSTYQLDRSMSITLNRPFSIVDTSIRVVLPNPWMAPLTPPVSGTNLDMFDTHTRRAHNHVFSMSQLESEIVHVQQSQTWTVTVASPRVDFAAWLRDVEPRLREWYATIPELNKAHPASIFAYEAYWDIIYHRAILLLYRPNSVATHLSLDNLSIIFESSCKMISSIRILQRDGKIPVLWEAVYQLFMAGLGVIYYLWYPKEIRNTKSISSYISTLQSCASTLSAMAETFPAASGCRDAFDTLSSSTIDWLVTNDAEKTQSDRPHFEDQMRDLLQQLQQSRGAPASLLDSSINMPVMLSVDNFSVGEMLSSAAQWPDPQAANFNGLFFDSIGDEGGYNGPSWF